MKFNFKIQQYQTDAVDAVVTVFNGQGFHDKINYIRDLGKMKSKDMQMTLGFTDEEMQLYDPTNDTGYKNELVELSDEQLLSNIQALQRQNNIKLSNSLVKDLGRCSLDIEMETGTGKTYAYIKTMFELNKKYGWSKFIVVVPSIAIREGVKKSFEITADHFMEHYGKKARFFIYNSSNLNQLDNFSSSSGINVMIINTQAFASSLKEDGRSKEARIIYSKRDEFGSRRPIDVIKANRPIIILDEPQKMGGEVTQKALKNFNPLFSLNYSATHAKHHNLIYVLDALDAFNKKLVKKIEVKGFEVKNFRGTDSYLYLEQIVLSSKKPPMAKIELEIGYNKSINRESRILGVGDDLYYVSQEMEQYKGYTISEIDPLRGTVTFTNGEVISTGDIVGDISEKDMRRIQIRETILSHFEKEEKLFDKYIKVDDVPTLIDDETANAIEFYLIQNGYVDMKRKVTDKYRQEIKSGTVAELPDELKPMAEGIHTLIQSVYDDSILQDMFTDGHETKVKDNPLNDNFAKKEFQALWREINHKYAYTVEFDSDELIKKATAHIDEKLFVSELQYTTTIGRQKAEMNEYEVERGASFTGEKTRTQTLKHAETSQIKYDLIGKVAEGTTLTRKTVSAILQGIRADKLYMFKNNPEEFITKVIRLINEQKATMIVEHISYDTIEGEYDSTIFTAEKNTQSFDKAFLAKKAIQDYVFTDGSAEQSIERRFAEDLDAAEEVCVYAKLPRTFQIPTPVGNYSPDWAIAFYEGTVKHIFFVAETKGTMETLNLRPIEQAKISCAKKLFNEMSNSKVVYHDVDSYQSLLNIMNSI